MQAQNRKNSNSNLKIPGANVDTGSLGVLIGGIALSRLPALSLPVFVGWPVLHC
jgi:hypothetical protein